jgi:hypothetical protein
MIKPDPENKPASTPALETEELNLDQLQQVSAGTGVDGESAGRVGGESSGRVDGESEGRVDRTSTAAKRFGWDLIKNAKA